MSRWSDLAVWRGPTQNNGGRRTRGVRGMCLHIAEGYYEGTIAWQLNPASEISSHFVVGRAGNIAQMVDTQDVAWTQSAGNQEWLTVEFEGFPQGHQLWRPGWEALTSFQIEAAARLFVRGRSEFGYPLQVCTSPSGQGLGHHSMGGAAWGGHFQCPGTPILGQKGEIVARAQAMAGTSPAPAPAPGTEPHRPFPLPAGHVFGPKADPRDWVHGGIDDFERSHVREIQWCLQATKFADPAPSWADGVWDPPTTPPVLAFQRSRGLQADGLVGPITWRSMFS